MLAAQVARGGPVRFYLDLGCRYLPEEMSANVIGEITGSEKPEEIVLLVGHLDSWDLGTGALDDGVGCSIAAAVGRLIGGLSERPKRTLRVWFAANEEFGLDGAHAYAEQYALDVDLHFAATEADFGVGSVWRFHSRIDEAHLDVARDLERLFEPLGIEYVGNDARGGPDLSPLRPSRVPVFDLSQDGTAYFDYHDTINDTLDKIDPESLRQNVAAYATWAYVMANYDGEIGRAPEPEEPSR